MVVAVIEEEHVRRRVQHPQGAIDRERVGVRPEREPLGGHDLDDVAGRDVLLGGADDRHELARRQVRLQAVVQPDALVELGHRGEALAGRRPVESGQQRVDPLAGGDVVGVQVAVERQPRDCLDRPPRMVEHQQRVDEHQAGQRQPVRVVRRGRQPLEAAGDLVGHEADRAADEARQAGQAGHLLAPEQLVEQHQRVGEGQRAGAVGRLEVGPVLADLEHLARRRPDERVAADVLAALDALEEERVPAAAELQVGRDRRFEVGQHLAVDRRELRRAGQRAGLGERRGVHQAPPVLPTPVMSGRWSRK